MDSWTAFDTLREAIARRRCVRLVSGHVWRDICPLALGYKGEQLKVLAFQYHGGSNSGIAPEGGWRCFSLDEIDFAKLNDDPWHSGHNTVAKLETSLDTVLYGSGARVRTYENRKPG